MGQPREQDSAIVFSTALGWMGLLTAGTAVRHLVFGHPTAETAARRLASPALGRSLGTREFVSPSEVRTSLAGVSGWCRSLVRRFQRYTDGTYSDFRDVRLELGPLSDFRRRVLLRCREIPYGETLTYGELAAEVGSPGAARAVGNCMAANLVPLLVPCHRVVPAGSFPGPFSAPGGSRTKRRLLEMEARCLRNRPAHKAT